MEAPCTNVSQLTTDLTTEVKLEHGGQPEVKIKVEPEVEQQPLDDKVGALSLVL